MTRSIFNTNQKVWKNTLSFIFCYLFTSTFANAHDASSTYLANASILVTNGKTKVLFDPFFHKNFGQYQLVPEQTLKAVFTGLPPFDGIDAIIISHAHGDHFAADDVVRYLLRYPATKLIAPQQAINQVNALPEAKKIAKQLYPIELKFQQPPSTMTVDSLFVEGVRIPHAGWPQRADVENIVFRVTLKDTDKSPITVMHMGDADPDDDHYLPFKEHWQQQQTDTAFPPYWFFFSSEGNYILDELINAKQHTGVHVPTVVPDNLKATGKDYFSVSGDTREIIPQKKQ